LTVFGNKTIIKNIVECKNAAKGDTMDKLKLHDRLEQALNNVSKTSTFLDQFYGLNYSFSDGTCSIEFEVEDFMLNPISYLHGGISAFVLDSAMGYLCNKEMGAPTVTAEMKVQYMKGVSSGKLTCVAQFLKKGRRISYVESRIMDAAGNVLTHATATFLTVK